MSFFETITGIQHQTSQATTSANFIWNTKYTVTNLPMALRAVLSRLMEFLHDLSKHAAVNDLHLEKLAILFTPYILSSPQDLLEQNMLYAQAIVKQMVVEHGLLFVVSFKDCCFVVLSVFLDSLTSFLARKSRKPYQAKI